MTEHKNTTKELREICQNVGAQHDAQTIFGLTNRVVSIYFTKVFIKLGITPNWITTISTIVYLVGIGFIATGDKAGALVGVLLMILGGILDACDGEVARFRARERKESGNINEPISVGASYVEPISHDIMYGLTFVPISFGAFLQTGNPIMLLFGAAASIFKLLYRLGDIRYVYGFVNKIPEEKKNVLPNKKFKEQSVFTKLAYTIYRHTATSTGLIPPLLVTGLLGRLDIYVLGYGTLFFLLWIAQFVKNTRRINRMI